MENQPKKSTENQESGNLLGQDNLRNDNSGSDNINANRQSTDDDSAPKKDIDDTDKYLAMEQPGISYTNETDPTVNSDQAGLGSESRKNKWNDEGGNSKNSDAFNQDDYILNDNLDLDEDQNKSISSDDEDFEETNERY